MSTSERHAAERVRALISVLRSGASGRNRLFELIPSHADVQLRSRQAETPRRLRLVPPAFAQHLRDRVALDGAEIGRVAAAGARRRLAAPDARRRSARPRTGSRRARARCAARGRSPASRAAAAPGGRRASSRPAAWPKDWPMLLQERLAQRQDVGAALAQRRRCGCRRPAADRTDPRGSRHARPPCAGRGWSRR